MHLDRNAMPNDYLEHLFSQLESAPAFRELQIPPPGGPAVRIHGLTAPARSLFIESLRRRSGRQLVLICASSDDADRAGQQLDFFSHEAWARLPHSGVMVSPDFSIDRQIVGTRLRLLRRIALGEQVSVVTRLASLVEHTLSPAELLDYVLEIAVGAELDPETLLARLVTLGYRPEVRVSSRGEFARRGGIIDLFCLDADLPVRIEFFGDEVASLRAFDPENQRSVEEIESATILPSREIILHKEAVEKALERLREEAMTALDREKAADEVGKLSQGLYFDGVEKYREALFGKKAWSALDYFGPDTLFVIDEPARLHAHWEEMRKVSPSGEYSRPLAQGLEPIKAMRRVYCSRLSGTIPWEEGCQDTELISETLDFLARDPRILAESVKGWLSDGMWSLLISEKPHRMIEILSEREIPASEKAQVGDDVVHVMTGRLDSGFRVPWAHLVVMCDTDILGSHALATRMLARARVGRREALPITSLLEISPGDYLVHIHHGIGVYRELTKLEIDGSVSEYLWIDYANGEKLFVPIDQIDRVQRYIGSGDRAPEISTLGSGHWLAIKRRVKKKIRELAVNLVELYGVRAATPGTAYSPDTPWQKEMETSFAYEETPDQLQAIEDVKQDLEEGRPMDRLICGDVGYGKTEVAVRAAFKVVLDGKQVALLVPTTVLAEQHLATIRDRLSAFPVRVEVLSRFRTKLEQKKALDDLANGSIDIVIGTHRLLSKDVKFSDLGLVIVDEEQRFGVGHKEKLKELRKVVDVLTLTATPIPRTLHMSLAGIRDMSLIEDPPEGRIPIRTYCTEYEDETVRRAILRELDRGGQVYYVHNRVESIGFVAEKVKRLAPQARVAVAHGQMPGSVLERVMLEFYKHEHDILVCTTIIESGLDIPNVNTIIIEDAHKLGLAQLYQLRGRVGRSDRQAYAYLFHRPTETLTDDAYKRIAAMREFSDLGSGYKLALRDLEIRGAGNLLGAEQHGFMLSVGFDLYCQMIAEAVRELRGEDEEESELPSVSLPVNALIPEDYVADAAERIILYKKIAGSRTQGGLNRVREELEDRFGACPPEVENLFSVMHLRIKAAAALVTQITMEKKTITVELSPEARLASAESYLVSKRFRTGTVGPMKVPLLRPIKDPVAEVGRLIDGFLSRRQSLLAAKKVEGRTKEPVPS
jgi:transcription-repair coupling factor (superfamily II helicase)